ncbi:hypothetical protein CHO01_36900 [Cellulomonas hominis]|uniref:Uncharacterized protein n=1 Tax=Cellulomonas hominis TaxID=156981 RepID=A0A511FJ21_9CELL|nr:hypothetical protein [Cellulomonas hominis]MBB5474726.1 hypothetical protein [Cellulomonas hominis]NKY05988.1 hypothetical protein [Cellulomonas hominis]GEL48574.1 hypothetical protein CHO01_36900 [Cellulomonas hominis]
MDATAPDRWSAAAHLTWQQAAALAEHARRHDRAGNAAIGSALAVDPAGVEELIEQVRQAEEPGQPLGYLWEMSRQEAREGEHRAAHPALSRLHRILSLAVVVGVVTMLAVSLLRWPWEGNPLAIQLGVWVGWVIWAWLPVRLLDDRRFRREVRDVPVYASEALLRALVADRLHGRLPQADLLVLESSWLAVPDLQGSAPHIREV